MNRFVKISLWLLLAGAVLSAVLVATALQWAGAADGSVFNIDGETFSLAELHGGQWLLVLGGVMLALLIVLLVVPFAVIVPLLCAALGITVALLSVLGVAALLLSPLLLLVWIVWRMARSPAKKPAATMRA